VECGKGNEGQTAGKYREGSGQVKVLCAAAWLRNSFPFSGNVLQQQGKWEGTKILLSYLLLRKGRSLSNEFRLTKKGYIPYLDSGDKRADISKCNIMDVIPLGLGI
jgi:hypothetical protein